MVESKIILVVLLPTRNKTVLNRFVSVFVFSYLDLKEFSDNGESLLTK